MTSKKVLFIRHGQSINNVTGSHWRDTKTLYEPSKGMMLAFDKCSLTEKGLEDARRLSEKLRQFDPEMAYVSPFLRAKQTCEEALQNSTVFIREDARIREIATDSNNSYPTPRAESIEDWQNFKKVFWGNSSHFKHPGEGYESFQDICHRALSFTEDLKNIPEERIVVFSHGNFLRILGMLLLEEEPFNFDELKMRFHAITQLPYADQENLTIPVIKGGQGFLVTFKDGNKPTLNSNWDSILI